MSRDKRIFEIIGLDRANQVLTHLMDEKAAEYLGLNRTDANAIDVIDQHGRITAGDLARALRLTTGAVTTVVDRLERAGFARRVADAGDRRRVLIEVTPIVHESAGRIYGRIEDMLSTWDDFTDADLDAVRRFQERSRTWTEERLANLDRLATEHPLPTTTRGTRGPSGKKELRGKGRT